MGFGIKALMFFVRLDIRGADGFIKVATVFVLAAITAYTLWQLFRSYRRHVALFNAYVDAVGKWLESGSEKDCGLSFWAFEKLKESRGFRLDKITLKNIEAAHKRINSVSGGGFRLVTRDPQTHPYREKK